SVIQEGRNSFSMVVSDGKLDIVIWGIRSRKFSLRKIDGSMRSRFGQDDDIFPDYEGWPLPEMIGENRGTIEMLILKVAPYFELIWDAWKGTCLQIHEPGTYVISLRAAGAFVLHSKVEIVGEEPPIERAVRLSGIPYM